MPNDDVKATPNEQLDFPMFAAGGLVPNLKENDKQPLTKVGYYADGGIAGEGQGILDAAMGSQDNPQQRSPASAPAMPDNNSLPTVNLINRMGQMVGVDASQVQQALQLGYREPTPEEHLSASNEEKYGGFQQQSMAGMEGLASTMTMGASSAAERAMGVPGEDILGRADVGPGHFLGSAAALLVPGLGEIGAVGKAGELAGKFLPGMKLAEEAGQAALARGASKAEAALASKLAYQANTSAATRIGSSAVKAAAEGAMLQSSDEVTKAVSGGYEGQEPGAALGMALADVGIAGLLGGGIGGALGAVPELWNATAGSKVGGILKTVTDKMGGQSPIPGETQTILDQAGFGDLDPVTKGLLAKDPAVQKMALNLIQNDVAKAGQTAQEMAAKTRKELSDYIVTTVGKTPKQVEGMADLSEFEHGKAVKDKLAAELSEVINPINERWERIEQQTSGVEMPDIMKSHMTDEIAKVANEQRWLTMPDSAEAKLVRDTLDAIPRQQTLSDFQHLGSNIGKEMDRQQLWHAGKPIQKIIREAQDAVIDDAVSSGRITKGGMFDLTPQELAASRTEYKALRDQLDTLNDRLHVGRFAGPKGFLNNLREMAPEDVLRRLSPRGDAGLIPDVFSKFPKTGAQVQEYQLNKLLREAAARAPEGHPINPGVFFKKLAGESPEMRNFLLPDAAQQQKLAGVEQLLEKLNSHPYNWSNTARTAQSLFQHVPGTAMGLIAGAMAGHVGLGALIGSLAGEIGHQVPAAAKLAFLRFLGSEGAANAGAFKASSDFIQAAQRGSSKITRAVKGLFTDSPEISGLAGAAGASSMKLSKVIDHLSSNPDHLLKTGGAIPYYMPEQGTAIGQHAANAVSMLQQAKPQKDRQNPLDPSPPVSKVAQAKYDRLLNMAKSPLSILNEVKKGHISAEDVTNFQNMYPSMHKIISDKMMQEIVNHSAKGKIVPYQTRLGMSMFMGQPLDSTMTQQAIMSAQPQQPQQQQPPQAPNRAPAASKLKGMGKMAQSYETPGQAAESRRASHR